MFLDFLHTEIEKVHFDEIEKQANRFYSLAIDPSYDLIYLQKGVLLLNLKKYEEAIKCLNDVLKFDPNNIDAKFLISESQLTTRALKTNNC